MDKSINYKSRFKSIKSTKKNKTKMESKDIEIKKLKEEIKMMDDYIKEQQETINTFPQMTIM